MTSERDWLKAVEKTWIVRFPRQSLATFGSTNIAYYVVTEPIYRDLSSEKQEGVVRTGKVIAERPSVITPEYAMHLRGFSPEAYEYLEYISMQFGSNSPGILYQYRNEAEKMDILSGQPSDIAYRISDDLESRKENLSVVMVGVDEFWDVALLKFIYEFTSSSASQNVQDFQSSGLLEPQPNYGGVPKAAIQKIEQMFREVESGAGNPDVLQQELERWGVFNYYEDRFLGMFRRR